MPNSMSFRLPRIKSQPHSAPTFRGSEMHHVINHHGRWDWTGDSFIAGSARVIASGCVPAITYTARDVHETVLYVGPDRAAAVAALEAFRAARSAQGPWYGGGLSQGGRPGELTATSPILPAGSFAIVDGQLVAEPDATPRCLWMGGGRQIGHRGTSAVEANTGRTLAMSRDRDRVDVAVLLAPGQLITISWTDRRREGFRLTYTWTGSEIVTQETRI